MERRRIGSLEVSAVGLGCNNFGGRIDEAATRAVVDAALDAGIDFFDTADIYGGTKSEEFLGRVLQGRRDKVVLATKFGMPVDAQRKGAHPDYVRRACEDSLRRLQTDRIDLYQLHQPDPEVPIADTLGALDELVRAGKVREIGCSNFSVAQLREAATASRAARFVSVQNELNLLKRDDEQGVLPECAAEGLAYLPFFPLAGGLLSGKYQPGQPAPQGTRLANAQTAARFRNERNEARAEKLRAWAEGQGHTLLELAFAWLLAKPQIASVIAGATRPEQVRANVQAATWKLTGEQRAQTDALAS